MVWGLGFGGLGVRGIGVQEFEVQARLAHITLARKKDRFYINVRNPVPEKSKKHP